MAGTDTMRAPRAEPPAPFPAAAAAALRALEEDEQRNPRPERAGDSARASAGDDLEAAAAERDDEKEVAADAIVEQEEAQSERERGDEDGDFSKGFYSRGISGGGDERPSGVTRRPDSGRAINRPDSEFDVFNLDEKLINSKHLPLLNPQYDFRISTNS